MAFVHLHVHTYYSILDGAAPISSHFQKAQEDNQPALAITDHGNMFGVKEFLKVAKGFPDIKPIIGCEVYVNPEGRFTKRGKEDQSAHHLILLAKNLAGYYNLVKLVSLGYTEGFYYKPKIDVLNFNNIIIVIVVAIYVAVYFVYFDNSQSGSVVT